MFVQLNTNKTHSEIISIHNITYAESKFVLKQLEVYRSFLNRVPKMSRYFVLHQYWNKLMFYY